jgi:hypothetical protein
MLQISLTCVIGHEILATNFNIKSGGGEKWVRGFKKAFGHSKVAHADGKEGRNQGGQTIKLYNIFIGKSLQIYTILLYFIICGTILASECVLLTTKG